jgi:hypothetical protein
MSRPSKGARLYKRKARYHDGNLVHQSAWITRDGDRDIAKDALRARLKHNRRPRHIREK